MCWAVAMLGLAAACDVGMGEGWVRGSVVVEDCSLRDTSYAMKPNFFAAEAVGPHLQIRLQRNSDFVQYGDGLSILVRDVGNVKASQLNAPVPLSVDDDAPVKMVFYLNDSCTRSGRGDPVTMVGIGGNITFSRLYADDVDSAEDEIEGSFSVLMEDAAAAEERTAALEGYFNFEYARGRPAQLFP